MSKLLHVAVQNAVAKYQQRDGDIVCCNKYRIRFTFDSEWDGYEQKTARFIWGGAYEEVDFTGDTCEVPVIHDAGQVEVGVYAGDSATDPHTSTGAIIPCRGSIKSVDVPPSVENDKRYANEAKEAADRAEAAADRVSEVDPEVLQTAIEDEVANQLDGAKADIVAEIIEQLGGLPVFGTVDDDNTIIVTSALADGQYVLKYKNEDGALAEIGTITIGKVGPAYTNLYDAATMATAEYLNKRINSSGVYTDSSAAGHAATPYIPVQINAGEVLTVRIKGAPQQTTAYGYARIMAYTSDSTITPISDTPAGNIAANWECVEEGGGVFAYSRTINEAASHMRFVIYVSGSEVTAADVAGLVITVNEAIE